MAKGKSPSEVNSRVVRVNIGDYLLLTELSRKLDITVAKALHLAITDQARQSQVTVTPRTQIPMAIGTTAYRVTGLPQIAVTPVTSIATNGSKAAALRIKPGRVRYD